MSVEWLVVGLGNPGPKYARTRHNVGFMALDEMARGVDFRSKFSGQFAMQGDLALLKPETFMNLSGDSVQPALGFLKLPPARLLVLHDELDIPFGDVRVKQGGGHAGHNGLRSIIGRLGGPDFFRVRIGIGRPPADFVGDVASYVLGDFGSLERSSLSALLERATASARKLIEDGGISRKKPSG